MTRRIKGIGGAPYHVLIEPEPDAKCELCGKVAELRPYGPSGARICFACAMQDPEGTSRRMAELLFGADN